MSRTSGLQPPHLPFRVHRLDLLEGSLPLIQGQKYWVVVLFLGSLAMDVLWLIVIYLSKWNTDVYRNMAPWETGLHITCLWMAIINFVLKVALTLLDRFRSVVIPLRP